MIPEDDQHHIIARQGSHDPGMDIVIDDGSDGTGKTRIGLDDTLGAGELHAFDGFHRETVAMRLNRQDLAQLRIQIAVSPAFRIVRLHDPKLPKISGKGGLCDGNSLFLKEFLY